MLPDISVLMPAYNAASYIAEAIESVLSQDFKNFEFIIINDGSTDSTLSVIERYNDPRIRLISRPNKGLIDSLNEGILLAQSDIIARMDADDVCLPGRLSLQYSFLQKNQDYILVGSEAELMDKDGNDLFLLQPIGYSNEEISERIDLKCPFIHPCVTFRKEAVIAAGAYPKDALTFEDHLLWKKLLQYGKVCNLKIPLLKVRFNPESVTIDEKWRGPDFLRIRKDSIRNGVVSPTDAAILKALISKQNFSKFKEASYYTMIAKKYLWNIPNTKLARENLQKSMSIYKHKETYLLYAMSFLPFALRKGLYSLLKRN